MNTEQPDPEVEAVRSRVAELRTKGWRELAKKSGVKFWTVRKFAYGEVKIPRLPSYRAIERALAAMDRAKKAAR